MKTDLFNYDLPPELIAQHPPERRELARMLVLHRNSGNIEHRTITDIVDYLRAPDVLVLNNRPPPVAKWSYFCWRKCPSPTRLW